MEFVETDIPEKRLIVVRCLKNMCGSVIHIRIRERSSVQADKSLMMYLWIWQMNLIRKSQKLLSTRITGLSFCLLMGQRS